MAKKQDNFQEKNDAARALSLGAPGTHTPVKDNELAAARSRLNELAAAQTADTLTAAQNTFASYSSLDGVPEEVRKNLIGAQDMIVEGQLLNILTGTVPGMSFTVDKIILALWHKFQYSEPRNKVISRLRLMAKRGLVIKDESARSVYRAADRASREVPIPPAGGLVPHPAE